MTISAVDASASQNMELSALTSKVMDKDDFLNLLITQLQNQDPLKPTDSTEFTAQLAQFSSLEQLSNVNENLQTLQLFQASINNAQTVSFIGKEITAEGNGLQRTNGEPVACNFELTSDAGLVVVNIYDATGEFVKAFESQSVTSGHQSLIWDGTDNNGNAAPDGGYTFEVMAMDAEGQSVEVRKFTNAMVSGVTYVDNQTYLVAGDRQIALGDVVNVRAAAVQNTEN